MPKVPLGLSKLSEGKLIYLQRYPVFQLQNNGVLNFNNRSLFHGLLGLQSIKSGQKHNYIEPNHSKLFFSFYNIFTYEQTSAFGVFLF